MERGNINLRIRSPRRKSLVLGEGGARPAPLDAMSLLALVLGLHREVCCRDSSGSGAPSSLESGCIGTWALLGARTVMARSGRSGAAWERAFRAAAKEWRCCRETETAASALRSSVLSKRHWAGIASGRSRAAAVAPDACCLPLARGG